MSKRLTEKQLQAIEILSTNHGMEYKEIAAQVGVSDRTLRTWRNDDDFNRALKDAVVRKTLDRLPEVLASVPDHIITQGNAAMLRTFLQMHGLLTEKHEVESKGNNGNTADMADIRSKVAQYRKAE
ncbi:phBC6A51 family helix-turn-helix protein [Evansella clarkii]|uniref:phBC6A51 family helix-turn-helix protein n=1 Tax=Evansella clarkii TaxID=79879 RepID=UPI000B452652|nr:phBC6A51 family helix-turn-helix protein [Evansella clarkii]